MENSQNAKVKASLIPYVKDLVLFFLLHRPLDSACKLHTFPAIDHDPYAAVLCVHCTSTIPNGLFPFLLNPVPAFHSKIANKNMM
jgi:hypothetical protein